MTFGQTPWREKNLNFFVQRVQEVGQSFWDEMQCEQIGWFSKILRVKVSFKISLNVRWPFGLFESITFQEKTAVTFLGNFWKTLGYF